MSASIAFLELGQCAVCRATGGCVVLEGAERAPLEVCRHCIATAYGIALGSLATEARARLDAELELELEAR